MIRKSYDEESEFQNKLNFAKHRPEKKTAAAANANGSQLHPTHDLLVKSIGQKAMDGQAKKSREVQPIFGNHRASVVSQQTIMYPTSHLKYLDQPQAQTQNKPTNNANSLADIDNIELDEHSSSLPQQLGASSIEVKNPQHLQTMKVESKDSSLQKRGRRKVVRRVIIRKRTSDGHLVPVEATKTVIERDGSKSITRLDPALYATKFDQHHVFEDEQRFINLNNQAKLIIPSSKVSKEEAIAANDAQHRHNVSANVHGSEGGAAPSSMSAATLEHLSSTTYQTTAYRASSGAIVLNKIATTTMLQPQQRPDTYGLADNQSTSQLGSTHTTSKRKIKKIVVKKKSSSQSNAPIFEEKQSKHHQQRPNEMPYNQNKSQ